MLLIEQPTTFADFRPELITGIRGWLLPNHYDEASTTKTKQPFANQEG